MDKIAKLREEYFEELQKLCEQQSVSFESVQKLLEAEKSKKMFKRVSLIQQTIDREIENILDHEN